MNPLRWKREHQISCFIFCLIGAFCGLFFSWRASDYISRSGSDYTNFFHWVQDGQYWPWPLFGALIPGLLFYAIKLLRA